MMKEKRNNTQHMTKRLLTVHGYKMWVAFIPHYIAGYIFVEYLTQDNVLCSAHKQSVKYGRTESSTIG